MTRSRAVFAVGSTLVLLAGPAPVAAPVGTAFTYQGSSAMGRPASGTYDLELTLWTPRQAARRSARRSPGGCRVTSGFLRCLSISARPPSRAARAGWRSACGSGQQRSVHGAGGRQELTPAPNAINSQTASLAGRPWGGLTDVPAGFADASTTTAAARSPRSRWHGLTAAHHVERTIAVSFGTTGTTVAAGSHGHFGASWLGDSGDYACPSARAIRASTGHLRLASATGGYGTGVRVSPTRRWAMGSRASRRHPPPQRRRLRNSSSTEGTGVQGLALATTEPTGCLGQSASTAHWRPGAATATSASLRRLWPDQLDDRKRSSRPGIRGDGQRRRRRRRGDLQRGHRRGGSRPRQRRQLRRLRLHGVDRGHRCLRRANATTGSNTGSGQVSGAAG